jgi:hypothetical protein
LPFSLDGCEQLVSVDTAAPQAPWHEWVAETEPLKVGADTRVLAHYMPGAEDHCTGTQALCLSDDMGLRLRRDPIAEVCSEAAHNSYELRLPLADKIKQFVQRVTGTLSHSWIQEEDKGPDPAAPDRRLESADCRWLGQIDELQSADCRLFTAGVGGVVRSDRVAEAGHQQNLGRMKAEG